MFAGSISELWVQKWELLVCSGLLLREKPSPSLEGPSSPAAEPQPLALPSVYPTGGAQPQLRGMSWMRHLLPGFVWTKQCCSQLQCLIFSRAQEIRAGSSGSWEILPALQSEANERSVQRWDPQGREYFSYSPINHSSKAALSEGKSREGAVEQFLTLDHLEG